MFKTFISLILLALILGAVYILWRPQSAYEEVCYIWNTEAGDHATLRMRIVDATDITGSFDFAPAEKDRKTGEFEGRRVRDMAYLTWNATAEGWTELEELNVQFGVDVVRPGFGEMKEENGMLRYANPQALTYPVTLQKAECGEL